jgi:hypothetical protein
VKEGYEGRRFTEAGRIILRGISFLEGSLGFAQREESLSSVVGLDQYRGHRFAGGFGHGGQDIHMISWS